MHSTLYNALGQGLVHYSHVSCIMTITWLCREVLLHSITAKSIWHIRFFDISITQLVGPTQKLYFMIKLHEKKFEAFIELANSFFLQKVKILTCGYICIMHSKGVHICYLQGIIRLAGMVCLCSSATFKDHRFPSQI